MGPFGSNSRLSDLKEVSPEFANQILNCINTLIYHRLNDSDSAESVSIWAGTEDIFDITAQLDINKASAGLGSIRQNKKFSIHPDAIKRDLKQGEAFLVSKVINFIVTKIKVKLT